MAWEEQQLIHLPSAACGVFFLLYLPFGHRAIHGSPVLSATRWPAVLKSLLGLFLATALTGLFVRRSTALEGRPSVSFALSAVASASAALGLAVLLYLGQRRLSRPSDAVIIYLVTTVACDVVVLTAPSAAPVPTEVGRLVSVRLLGHSLLLALELLGPRTPSVIADVSARQSPEEKSDLISRAFFGWINPILVQGYKNILINRDLPHLSQDVQPATARGEMLRSWNGRAKPETKMTLPLALLRCAKQPFIAAIIPRLFVILFRYSQPILIKQSIRHVTVSSASSVAGNDGYWLVLYAVVVYTGLAISTGVYEHRLNRLVLITHSALTGIIHDKTLESPSTAHDTGEAVTLMSTDAGSLENIGETVHEIWGQIVGLSIGIVQLATEVGWIWPLPLFFILLSSRVSRYVARNLQPRQKAWNEATQRRVAAISSMLSSMKLVKMLGFQHHLARRAQGLRKEELQAASRVRWMNVYYNSSANAVGIFSPALTLVLYAVIAAARGQTLDAEAAFTTMAILGIVTHPANMIMTMVPRAVASLAGFERIQNYLLRPSLHDHRRSTSTSTLASSSPPADLGINDAEACSSSLVSSPQQPISTSTIRIRDLTLGDSPQHQSPLVERVDIAVPPASLVVLSGSVGSGKSTLLRAVLGEIPPVKGSIELSTKRIAYSAQRPWLPSGTIKDVILGCNDSGGGGQWYQEVVKACCLDRDLDQLPEGDQTFIGSGGTNLSGGQRQRVALARAAFARCDIALLDDVLSALDGETETKVFNNLFGSPDGLFRRMKTTVLLVLNSAQFFSSADHIVILGDGTVKEQGRWDDIREKAAAIEKFIPSSGAGASAASTPSATTKLTSQLRARDEAEVDLARKTGDIALYGYYFKFIRLLDIGILTGCALTTSVFFTVPQYWLRLWTESTVQNDAFYMCGFLLMSLTSWAATSMLMWSTMVLLAANSGFRLHQRLLDIVTGASLTFFSENETGSILNRFSNDMQLIDKRLPLALQTIEVQAFKLLTQIVVLLMVQKLLSLSLPVCVLVVYLVQKVYLRTSRQLRFLELESRAAVFSSFLESIEGIETIRSFGWRGDIVRENVARLEASQRPEFLLMALQRWLNIVLDLMAAAIAIGVIFIAASWRDSVSGGQVGVALNIMLVANQTVLKLVQSWTNLEVSLGAISRLKILEQNTPQENETKERFVAADDWPRGGRVWFKNVTVTYGGGVVALRNFSLEISAGQRVVLCGRTGSGKSSVLLTLLRMISIQSGKILVDGVDLNRLSQDLLRGRAFIAVSQDALLLPNETLRFNLDPDGWASDETLVQALGAAGLWQHIRGDHSNGYSAEEYCEHPVLDRKLSSFQAFSAGQCQLFALTRAVVRADISRVKGALPIILLDEATSALDSAVEATVHRIIDEEFTEKGHTVIMVSHRVGGLFRTPKPGRDVVVWMRDGGVEEVVRDPVYGLDSSGSIGSELH